MSGPRFSIMPGWVFTDSRFKPMDIRVLGMLGRHIDKAGWCTRSQVRLAKEMGVARSTVQSSLRRMCAIGVVQKRENQTADGRDCSHDWRIIFDNEEAEKGAESPIDTPAGISAPPAAISAGPADPAPAPYKNVPLKTKEREDARARNDDGAVLENDQPTVSLADEDNPAKAAFTKRVQRFCNGETFSAGEWTGWAGSSMDWIAKQFAALSVEDRKAAETWRDAYLRDMARQKIRPIPVGKFFTAKQWEALSPDVLARDAKAKQQNLPADKTPVKEGWVNAWGPVFNAFIIAQFLKGRQDDDEGVPVVRVHIRAAYPVYESLWRCAEQRKGAVIGKPWHGLKEHMEFVQPGERLDDWRDAFKAREWVWPSAFNAEAGAYLPKGGPDALSAFEQAVREAITNNPKEGGSDDA